MSLTPQLVECVHHEVRDAGPPPGFTAMSDADYDEILDGLLAARRDQGDIWIFAYGSLIWRPACATENQRFATLRGWHRDFCLKLVRFRGTPEFPGLMMALDRGGSCRGVMQRLPRDSTTACLSQLIRREMSVKPSTNRPRWVTIESGGERVRAIAIAADRKGHNYDGGRSIEDIAHVLSRAVGHWGSGAEYLLRTVTHLEELGIHDRYLWKLQELVAEKIRSGV
ncbi:MAG: gamma-glutamylcyclotransferase [Dongiaceae bacterium]